MTVVWVVKPGIVIAILWWLSRSDGPKIGIGVSNITPGTSCDPSSPNYTGWLFGEGSIFPTPCSASGGDAVPAFTDHTVTKPDEAL